MTALGCTSITDIEIPKGGGSDFFKPEEGNTKIRFIRGPIIYLEAQEFDKNKKPIGERRFYPYGSEEGKKNKARLVISFFIYDYKDKKIKQWNIGSKSIQKTVQTLNALNPDLSLMDCVLTRTVQANQYDDYRLASGQNSEFTDKEALKEFVDSEAYSKAEEWIAEKIEETLANKVIENSNNEFDTNVVNAEPAVTKQEAEDLFA